MPHSRSPSPRRCHRGSRSPSPRHHHRHSRSPSPHHRGPHHHHHSRSPSPHHHHHGHHHPCPPSPPSPRPCPPRPEPHHHHHHGHCPEPERESPEYFFIQNQCSGRVLDAKCYQDKPGTHVISYPKKEPACKNQAWRLEPRDGKNFIISAMDRHLVLDVEYGRPNPGSNLIIWHKKSPPRDNQLFEFRSDGKIVSALTSRSNATLFIAPEPEGEHQVVLKELGECDCDEKKNHWTLVPIGKDVCHLK